MSIPLRPLASLGVIILAAFPVHGSAQGVKRATTPTAWDSWRTLTGAVLSADGRWVAFTVAPQVGDGELVVHATRGSIEHRVTRGFVGRAQLKPAADSASLWVTPPAQMTPDGSFAAALTYAPKAAFDSARRAKRPEPKASLTLIDLAAGTVTVVPRVKSFRMARDTGRWLVYLLEPVDSASTRMDSAGAASGQLPMRAAAAPGGAARPVASEPSKGATVDRGSTLVMRDLITAGEIRVEGVTSYALDDSATIVADAVATGHGGGEVAVRTMGSGAVRRLVAGVGSVKQLAVARTGGQVAFLATRENPPGRSPRYVLYHAPRDAAQAAAVVDGAALTGSMIVGEKGKVEFTRDGAAIVFGIAAPPLDSIPSDSLAEKAVFDLWHWKDARLQPQQRVEGARDRERAFVALWRVGSHRVVQLADDSLPTAVLSRNGRTAIVSTTLPYAVDAMWGDGGADVYAVDAVTGRRALVKRRARSHVSVSPDGGFVLYFDEGHWKSFNVATGTTADLTGGLARVRFDQETWDSPAEPEPWGVGGWTRGDASVLLYDRYDIWEADPRGTRPARIVTDSAGVRRHIIYRSIEPDPDEELPEPGAAMTLRAMDDETKESGFWRVRVGSRQPPQRIVMGAEAYGRPLKARQAEVYAVTISTFERFPDIWAGPRLDALARLSDANPQQGEYRWGSVELVRWRNADGVALKGLLYKPEGFDSTKKYPMVVYYYERLSDNLFTYIPPAGRNVINPTHYVSNGYLVFEPDIAYTVGYPGPSALKAVVPGVQSLVARGFVDEGAIGLQGQSWGGYQTAYIVTQTNMFKAAMAGAPVANMTSAYGGIRWQTGLARPFQYERTQSRIGGSLWQFPLRYLENSPLFQADRIQTPLLIMANDNDGSVPWYQGIELFIALRRLGRETYLIDYNGDEHNPTKRANQQDIAIRMQQFFDHHLRGSPAPDWMQRGVPFLRKGRDQARADRTGDRG
ncbi:MAG: hypothetical protein NVS1B4_20870 [Gemmatimonadaceae bacterium]